MRLMYRAVLAVFAFATLAAAVRAGEAQTGFVPRLHKGSGGDSKYVLFVPHGYKGDKEFPLILFLHGAGERGEDGEAPVKQGVGSAIKFKGAEKNFPCFVIFPQCRGKGNWKAGGPDADRALAILDEVMKEYKIDSKRLYLTGLSLGGFGTWSLAAAHPEKWAAIAPICGGGDPGSAERIKHIPCWCFHGDQDQAIKVEQSRDMIEALKAAGGKPKYDEYKGVGHNCWDRAYTTKELYDWLLMQRLK